MCMHIFFFTIYKIEKEEIHICEDISMIKNYPLWVNEYYKYML